MDPISVLQIRNFAEEDQIKTPTLEKNGFPAKFTCSKSSIKTVEKGLKYVQS